MTTIDERTGETTAAATERATPATTLLVDVDVHPMYLPRDILPRLPEPWRTRLERSGGGRGSRQGSQTYPRLRNGGYRVDAAVEGGFPGSDLGLMQEQLLDQYGHDVAVLIPLIQGAGEPAGFQAAMAHAVNEWVREEWLERDPRLLATLNVPFDYPDLAVAEIERYADDKRFVQVAISGGAHSEWGDRKYWPIYEAAEARGLVMMCHVGGGNNGYRGAGAPSFYLEQHIWLHTTMVRLAMGMICEGVFNEFPALQVALVEACISWAGPLQWAMDATFEVLGEDLPHLEAPPSQYFRDHYWMSTQPIEEPDDPAQLLQAIEFTGMTDRIMFSSDYPHWDFDSPDRALPISIRDELRDDIYGQNATHLYTAAAERAGRHASA